ncbi:DNA-binding response regulator [Candidatus Peregrinibacteria bacterium CG10_big_fil_rev_8_21_14_0_10_49_10]|nr:MAG: DNA-binding response regulator [Candidatus Peregrinibacteria bacterium CG10_big_fil_rev_8_21_14_0_10_49_10]
MRILIIEDEHALARNIQKYLLLEKCTADAVFDGEEGFQQASVHNYDCIVLDLNLPKLDGREICRLLREQENNVPILMLTARAGTEDVVRGLNIGADDYLCKPFEMEELLARIRALIRRKSENRSPILDIKGVCLDANTQIVSRGKKQIALSPKEYMLLEYLMRNANRALQRTSIISHVWGAQEDQLMFSQTLDVHIAYLRKKVGKDLIETIPGTGYMISTQS